MNSTPVIHIPLILGVHVRRCSYDIYFHREILRWCYANNVPTVEGDDYRVAYDVEGSLIRHVDDTGFICYLEPEKAVADAVDRALQWLNEEQTMPVHYIWAINKDGFGLFYDLS